MTTAPTDDVRARVARITQGRADANEMATLLADVPAQRLAPELMLALGQLSSTLREQGRMGPKRYVSGKAKLADRLREEGVTR